MLFIGFPLRGSIRVPIKGSIGLVFMGFKVVGVDKECSKGVRVLEDF